MRRILTSWVCWPKVHMAAWLGMDGSRTATPGQVKGFVVFVACESQLGAVPVVPANTGQAHLFSAQPVLAVSLGTCHLLTSSCSDLGKVLPKWMQRDPSLVLQQDLNIFESAFGRRLVF